MIDRGDDGPPPWDEDRAQALIGALVLIGITRIGPEGTSQEQMYGEVIAAEADAGVTVALAGSREGERLHLPPALETFQPAQPGQYRLRSTGEVVTDPDYTASWTVNPPQN